MDLLRFAAAGSVDDGKSTLIGRLLHDAKQLFDDQLDALERARRQVGRDAIDLSFVTDGLRAEREQGITIDVAYRYAATPRRKFIIADCPGHLQYTRNMATGASTADLVLLVVDATAGLKPQTRRHLCIAALLGVRQVIACVNKMDLTGWSLTSFEAAKAEISEACARLGIERLTVIPVSALHGDNVVDRSPAAPFYEGPSVLEALEEAPPGGALAGGALAGGALAGGALAGGALAGGGARLPVQWVVRHPDGTRTFAGMVCGGALRPGDEVVVLPAGTATTVTSVETVDGPLDYAHSALSVRVALAGGVDAARGDMIAARSAPPDVTTSFEATVCWFAEQPLEAGRRYRIKHTTRVTHAVAAEVTGLLDVNQLELRSGVRLAANDIGVVRWTAESPLAVDDYKVNRMTGGFVVIDDATNATTGAGMIGVPNLPLETPAPQLYPVGLVIEGRACLVVGGGRVAERKVRGLLACGASVTVVAPRVVDGIASLAPCAAGGSPEPGAAGASAEPGAAGASAGRVEIRRRRYSPGEAPGYRLVIAATGNCDVDRTVAADADAAGVWVNIADDPAGCTFTLPAVHRDGAVTIAVATGGGSPAAAVWLRDRLAALAGPHLGELVNLLRDARATLHRRGDPTDGLPWTDLLDDNLAGLIRAEDFGAAREVVDAWLAEQPASQGQASGRRRQYDPSCDPTVQ